jgi:hypothetical protein
MQKYDTKTIQFAKVPREQNPPISFFFLPQVCVSGAAVFWSINMSGCHNGTPFAVLLQHKQHPEKGKAKVEQRGRCKSVQKKRGMCLT